MDCINEVVNVVYAESRGEGATAMRAVALVILNRAKEEGVRPCIIVNRPNQFAKAKSIVDWKSWELAKLIARNPGPDITHGATFFHARSVKPYWIRKMRITYQFGSHIFYKNPSSAS